MPQHVLLDNVTHKDLRIITDHSASYGDDIPSVLTFPVEFRRIQAHYPICFSRDSEDNYHAAALMGFEEGENLFLGHDGWDADYIPLMLRKQPFLIGFQNQDSPANPPQRVIHVDLDSPRISYTEGEPVFLEYGGNTPYLNHISTVLETIYQGQVYCSDFCAVLSQHELLEPFVFNIRLVDGSENQIAGFHMINEEKLKGLPDSILGEFMTNGFLESIYMVMASQENFAKLIERKNRKLLF